MSAERDLRAKSKSQDVYLMARIWLTSGSVLARTQLANLITYMDGKTGAEELIAKVLKNPALLQTLASSPKPASS